MLLVLVSVTFVMAEDLGALPDEGAAQEFAGISSSGAEIGFLRSGGGRGGVHRHLVPGHLPPADGQDGRCPRISGDDLRDLLTLVAEE